MNIEKVRNGYICDDGHNGKEVFGTIDEVFDRMLLHFEGRCKNFTGDSYGNVIVEREKAKRGK